MKKPASKPKAEDMLNPMIRAITRELAEFPQGSLGKWTPYALATHLAWPAIRVALRAFDPPKRATKVRRRG